MTQIKWKCKQCGKVVDGTDRPSPYYPQSIRDWSMQRNATVMCSGPERGENYWAHDWNRIGELERGTVIKNWKVLQRVRGDKFMCECIVCGHAQTFLSEVLNSGDCAECCQDHSFERF